VADIEEEESIKMTTIALAKNSYGALCPVNEQDQQYVTSLGKGEYILATIKKQRNAKFHRKWFKLVDFAFDNFHPKEVTTKHGIAQKNFKRFRKDIIILAGYFDQVYKFDGSVILNAKSISFGKMDDIEFRQLYTATFNAIVKYIFTNHTPDEIKAIETELERFV